ncbi:DUF2231 domain-containing protein [Fodinibius sp. Rm-B-1B1-1]|uniref:DUF2231 domain-containing protein n=1 Tax=Fodinibius alkaliphilus TaxID=3140241 RepID=UPI00315AFE4D
MELIPEWAPNIHPILVHFPIAIILLAVLMDLLNFFLPDNWWDDLKTTILYGVGAVSAIAAYYTGNLAANSVFLPSGAQSILTEHSDWALWTVWFFGIYAILRILLHWYQKIDQQAIRIGLFVLALPGVFFLYETGDHGAQLVFGYGAGTGQLLQQEESTSVATDSLMAETGTTFTVQENGNWSWEMGPNAVSALLENFHWLEGSIQDLQPAVVKSDNNYLLQLSGDSLSNFFTGHNSFQNVQVDYYLDLSDFEGDISLVNHVQDAQNYDFVTLTSDGKISQGRVSDGNREVFAEESYSASGMLFIRTVGNGTHFRGYINKEMVVHGHGDAPEAGSVGLKLNGTGTILIDRMTLTQLN